MCKGKCPLAIPQPETAVGGNLHMFMLTTEQVELLDEMLRQDIVDFPEAYADSLPFKALYTKVQSTLALIGK